MWQTKIFKTHKELHNWIHKESHKYIWNIIFINNGFGVEYKPLREIYIGE